MLRIRAIIMMALFYLIGITLVQDPNEAFLDYSNWILILVIGAWFINATSLNDIADEKIDKINLETGARSLSSGKASKRELYVLSIMAAVISAGAAFAIKPILGAIVVVALFLNYLYSMPPVRITSRGIWATLLLPVGYVVLPFMLAVLSKTEKVSGEYAWLLLALYASFIGRIILKDFRDIKGDKKFGKKTFLVRHGAKKTVLVAIIGWAIGDIIFIKIFHEQTFFIFLVQFFVAGIVWALFKIPKESKIPTQVILVALVGRLGNAIVLGLITLLHFDYIKSPYLIQQIILAGVFVFGAYAAHVTYKEYLMASGNES